MRNETKYHRIKEQLVRLCDCASFRLPDFQTFGLLFFFCLLSFQTFSSPDQTFLLANDAYKKADYPKAIEQYQAALKEGGNNTEIFYNLGNAYYKTNQIGLAILNYEKALQLSPTDEDVLHNLKLANLKTADRINAVPELAIVSWWNRFIMARSSNSWALFSLVAIWVVLLFSGVYLFAFSLRKIGFFSGVVFLLFSLFFMYLAFTKKELEENANEGVLLTANAYIKSAPDTQSTDLFIIHEGIKFGVLDQVGEWTKIRLADGKVGWLQRNFFAAI